MKIDDIRTELMHLFEGMDTSRGGAVVAWHDQEGAFEEVLGELGLPGVEVLAECEGELFSLKRALNEELSGRRILLYRRRLRHLEGDWLADVEVRAAQFSADYTSVQLRELGAQDTAEMRACLKEHRTALSKRRVTKKLAALCPHCESPQQLELALVAVALGSDTFAPETVIRDYLLSAHRDSDPWTTLEQMGCAETFRQMVRGWTGFEGDASNVTALGRHVLLAALLQTAGGELPPALLRRCSDAQAAFCHGVFSEWARGPEREALLDLCCEVESSARLEEALAHLDTNELTRMGVFPCVDAMILRRLFAEAASENCDVAKVAACASARKNAPWYDKLSHYYDGVLSAVAMRGFYRDHEGEIPPADAATLWGSYMSDYYRMDTWYRQLHVAFAHAIRHGEYELDEDFRACCASMERLYKNWFLRTLARRWTDACERDLAQTGYAQGVPRQVDFYPSEVEPLVGKRRRACVIISDALRYEVGVELATQLERSTKGRCELRAMQATLPSVTAMGMATLLPVRTFRVETGEPGRGVAPLVNGRSTAGVAARQAILEEACPGAVAVQADSFLSEMDRAQRRDLIKDAEVFYVYHNTIDAIGDKPATERKVFHACAEAVGELVALVQAITREALASSVTITADHGFLYTAEPLAQAEHVAQADLAGEVLERGRRHIVARDVTDAGPFVRAALPGDQSASEGMACLLPRDLVRIRVAGDGENYVHGGMTLQEMCVPVLRFANKRSGAADYVATEPARISLVSNVTTITNTYFSLEFLQDGPVGGKVLPASYDVFVGDSAQNPVTDAVRVTADRAAQDASERTTVAALSLRPGASTSERETYYLYTRNIESGATEVLRELRICAAFAPTEDFGW